MRACPKEPVDSNQVSSGRSYHKESAEGPKQKDYVLACICLRTNVLRMW